MKGGSQNGESDRAGALGPVNDRVTPLALPSGAVPEPVVCVDALGVCLPQVPPDDDPPPPPPPPPPPCDRGEHASRILAMYAYPNGNNRVGSVGPQIANDTAWIGGQFDLAAGPTRDQEVRWRTGTNGTVLICAFSVSDPDGDGHVAARNVLRGLVAREGHRVKRSGVSARDRHESSTTTRAARPPGLCLGGWFLCPRATRVRSPYVDMGELRLARNFGSGWRKAVS